VLEPGQRLGSYEVERLVGRGGMAEVYRATHVVLERQVAIKVLNRALNTDPTFPIRFLREAKAVAKLNHPSRQCCVLLPGRLPRASPAAAGGRDAGRRQRRQPAGPAGGP